MWNFLWQGSTFRKNSLGPAGLQVFIFGHQDKYSSRQKLFIFKKKIEYNILKVF